MRPCLKWAGGKSQLLKDIRRRVPVGPWDGAITRYAEPFAGSGAVFFDLAQTCRFKASLLLDINEELISVYSCIQTEVEDLIEVLSGMERRYYTLSPAEQSACFYEIRAAFNRGVQDGVSDSFRVRRAAQMIFLNKTCFNGLFRVNAKNQFNVPFGKHNSPRICDAKNLKRLSQALQGVEIRSGDFEACDSFVDSSTFVYFDPPYRPLSKTAEFTSYSVSGFGEQEQRRLAAFFRRLDNRGASLMLSNSDPENQDRDDHFFDELYAGYHVERVQAKRLINSKGASRGPISELIITNY